MAKDEIVRTSVGAAEGIAVNAKKTAAEAALLKKKLLEEGVAPEVSPEKVEEAAAATAEGEVAAAAAEAEAVGAGAVSGDAGSFVATQANAAGLLAQTTGGVSNTALLVGGGVLLAGAAIAIASNSDGGGDDDDGSGTVTITPSAATVTEGGTQVTFTITGNPNETVAYALTGTATVGTDYTVSPQNQVVLDSNGQATVTVTANADALTEGNETIVLTTVGLTPPVSSSVTITDASTTPPTVITVDSGTGVEGTQVVLRVTGAPNTTGTFTLGGTAVNGQDYTVQPNNGQLSFNGDGFALVTVSVISDNLVEGNETLTITSNGVTSPVVTLSDAVAGTVNLTTKIETLSGSVFNSVQEFTPGGNDLINTLQTGDKLIGTGTSVLNAQVGNVNDNSEAEIGLNMTGVQTANFEVVGNVTTFDFRDVNGLQNLNVTRITQPTGDGVTFQDLKDETENLLISDATRNAAIEFNYAEGQLEGVNDVVNLALNDVRVGSVAVTQGDGAADPSEDEGFSAETFNVTVGGDGPTNVDELFLAPNAEEEEENGTQQTVNLTANQDLEVNQFIAQDAETVNIQANADIVVAADEDDINGTDANYAVGKDGPGFDNPTKAFINEANDGWTTADLRLLTITGAGDVSIDGLNGNVNNPADTEGQDPNPANDADGVGTDGFGDAFGVTVAAGTMTGDLRLGINEDTAADDLLSVTSGSGKDWIVSYGELGGDIATNGGNDIVEVRSNTTFFTTFKTVDLVTNAFPLLAVPDGIPDVDAQGNPILVPVVSSSTTEGNARGTVSIDTAAGDDVVVVDGDLLAHLRYDVNKPNDLNLVENQGFDDIAAAQISTGDGNDTVSVGALNSEQDGDNFNLQDANTDDRYFVRGAKIDTGNGNDVVESDELAEAAEINTGAGNDKLTIFVDVATVLGADDGSAQEVNTDLTVNTLGAIVTLGEGDDSLLFTDEGLDLPAFGGGPDSYLLVGEGAEIRAAGGADVLTVETTDEVDVVSHAITTTLTNKLITGVETANFTNLNAIGFDTDDNSASAVQNDDDQGFGSNGIVADIFRFDSALAVINLTSEEQPVLLNPVIENYEEGNATFFELNNLRSEIAVNLIAHETHVDTANFAAIPGLQDVGTPADDFQTILDFAAAAVVGSRNILLAPEAEENDDVEMFVDFDVDNAVGQANTFTLNILPVPAGSTDGGSFDLDLELGRTQFDTPHNAAASTTDDDDLLIENLVLNITDSASHLFRLNNFGDAGHTDAYNEGSLVVETSVTVNNTKAGTKINVEDTNADTIRILGAADVFLQISDNSNFENNYEIETGSGNDIIDMRADTVRANDVLDDAGDADAVDNVNEADIVRGGAGRNTLVVDGGNDLGDISVLDPDDDVFENLFNLQTILIEADNFGSGGQQIAIDEAAFERTALDTLLWTGSASQSTQLLIGDDFEVGNSAPNPGVLLLDSTDHEAAFSLEINSEDSDTDTQRVDLDVRVNVFAGTSLLFTDTGVEQAEVDVTVENSELANTVIGDSLGGSGNEGELDLDVVDGAIDSLVILDVTATGTAEGTNSLLPLLNGEDFDLFLTVSDDWADDSFPLVIDASDLADTDADDDTGGGLFDLTAETDAALTVTGTQNDDQFVGSILNDTIFGQAGDDDISGAQGDDTLNGEDGDDAIAGGFGADTINGGAGDDSIQGNEGEDVITGGEGDDEFIYNNVNESNGDVSDTIGDFKSGDDEFELFFNGTGGNDVFNLGTFASVANVGAGDASLQGTDPDRIRGDFFWSKDGVFAVDVDGNGDTTSLDDYAINVANEVAAADVNFNLDLGTGNDRIRIGVGEDRINGNAGNDEFVIVGSITQAQANAYITDFGNGGLDPNAGVENVVDEDVLTTVRGVSEANLGDDLQGGANVDTLHVFGTVDLTPVVIGSVENLIIHSDVTMTVSQFVGFDRITFAGDSDHQLSVIGDGTNGSTLGVELTSTQLKTLIGQGLVFVDNYGVDGAPGTADDPNGTITWGSDNDVFGPEDIVTDFNLDPIVNPAVLTFTSADVGNGSVLDGGNDTNEDGGLAVRLIGGVVGNATDLRFSDEGTTFQTPNADQFKVVDLPTGTVRGVFDAVQLGEQGADVMTALAGSNYFNAGQGNDTITGGGSADFLVGGAGDDALTGNAGNDTFLVTSGTDTVTDLVSADTFVVGAAGTMVANTTGFTADANDKNDGVATLTATGGGNVDLTLAAGSKGYTINDVSGAGLTLTGSAFADTINGGTGANTLNGLAGADTLNGGDNNDTLNGGADGDTLNGGNGNDTLAGDAGDDTLTGGAGDDTFNANGGIDAVTDLATGDDLVVSAGATANAAVGVGGFTADAGTSNAGTANINAAGGVNLTAAGGPNGYAVVDTSAGGNIGVSGSNFADTITGGSGANSLQGFGGNDTILGGGDADTIDGGAGDDAITGGTGNDTLTGGANNDTFNVDAGTDTVADLTTGDALVVSAGAVANAQVAAGGFTATAATTNAGTANLTAAAGSIDLSLAGGPNGYTANVNGAGQTATGSKFNDTLNGGAGSQSLLGNDGDDVLNGGAGSDTLTGDAGDDTFVVAADADLVTDLSTGDALQVSATGTVDATTAGFIADADTSNNGANNAAAELLASGNVDLSAATGTKGFTVTSTSTDVDVTGSAQGDVLTGDIGSNTLIGLAGDDTLSGDDGNDDLQGGAGIDTINGGKGNDDIDGGTENDTLNGNEGNDTILGGGGDDSITGGADNDALTGGAGADTFNVDAGADTVSDLETADDIIVTNGASVTATVGVAGFTADADDKNNNPNIGGAANAVINASGTVVLTAATGTGGWTVNAQSAISVTGSGFNDVLNGSGGADTLIGGAGADTLSGAGGSDTLTGGAGADLFTVASGTDTVTDLETADDFTVSGGATLNATTATFVADADDTNTGSTVNITSTGNVDLSGITGGNLGYTVMQSGGAAVTFIGSKFNDELIGGINNDTLTGGDGNDTLTGGAGADTFNVNLGIDSVTDLGGSDVLVVSAGATANGTVINSWTATASTVNNGTANITVSAANVDVDLDAVNAGNGFTLTATGANTGIDLTGSQKADSITGNSQANVIAGDLGADTLMGGGGDDTFVYEIGDASNFTAQNVGTDPMAAETVQGAEVIIDISIGDVIDLFNANTIVDDGDNVLEDNEFLIVQGTFAAGTFTVGAGLNTGNDSLMIFDGDGGTAGVQQEFLVLVGVNSAGEAAIGFNAINDTLTFT